jgi:hypothetical protein
VSFNLFYYQTRGKPADPQIYLEADFLRTHGRRPIW